MARTTAQAHRRLVTPFGSPATMPARRAERLLRQDKEMYDQLREHDSLGPDDFEPWLED